MAQRIIWTYAAQASKRSIYEYWNHRNSSKAYARKLEKLFNAAAEILSHFPNLGKKTDYPNVRLKLVRDYWMVYRITNEEVQILLIWDTRRNPDDFENLIARHII